eukprot:TRINITY_DN4060_c0_g1_i1.p1 TRINITY_DN4060_c0_g1~~TRINITY_DN4060_c0_g1_i1.p1  ORF type:complete len:963 (-),score=237.41 TRINITY_DN4060_c0_g1_i1:241-3129(-)
MAPAVAQTRSSMDLDCPFGELSCQLSVQELSDTAYEIFIAACRPAGRSTLTYIPKEERSASFSSSASVSPSLQKTLASSAASRVKRALGLRSSTSQRGSFRDNSPSKGKKPQTIGELMRTQMGVSEQTDARVRRALLRISAGQLGKRVENLVLPLELLQQFRPSDFPNPEEYQSWLKRNLKILEAGLLFHPAVPLERSNDAARRLRKLIREIEDGLIETGKNSEPMQALRSAVMTLASRSPDGNDTEICHWADGVPLNFCLYQTFLRALFDSAEETAVIDEVDELLELMKRTWNMLGINQMLHNICFTWILFQQFVATGQMEMDLLKAVENQLVEVSKDAKAVKDPLYVKMLSTTLGTIQGWAEKRLLAYHDTFQAGGAGLMENVLSVALPAAKILVEDISHEYRRRRKEDVDVARTRIDLYIRSSVRTAFAQMMEMADSMRRTHKKQQNPTPALVLLAQNTIDLARIEKQTFSPILKRWHPFAAGVAVATLHACYGRELKQFLSGVTALTSESIQALEAADRLEKELVQIAVEDSAECDDGGKGVIREMTPYEIESIMIELSRTWVKVRLDKLHEWVGRSLEQEVWRPDANKEKSGASAIEVLRIVEETLDAFFGLPLSNHSDLLPDIVAGLDKAVQYYIVQVNSGCGSKKNFIPSLPTLTRCSPKSKFWKKKDKYSSLQKSRSMMVAACNPETPGLTQLCVRINTLQYIRSELELIEKRISYGWKTSLEKSSGKIAPAPFGSLPDVKFELSEAGCKEGIQQLCEVVGYKVVFYDLSSPLWDSLYSGGIANARIGPFLEKLESKLEAIANTVNTKVRIRVVTALMKASFDGFLLVLLGGGPSRAFLKSDSMAIEEDFMALKDLFKADGDGLPEELVEKAASPVTQILPLFALDSEDLIDNFRVLISQANGLSSSRSRLPLPSTTGLWSPNDPNTLLRILCYRNDEAASKFLKKTYNLPKSL